VSKEGLLYTFCFPLQDKGTKSLLWLPRYWILIPLIYDPLWVLASVLPNVTIPQRDHTPNSWPLQEHKNHLFLLQRAILVPEFPVGWVDFTHKIMSQPDFLAPSCLPQSLTGAAPESTSKEYLSWSFWSLNLHLERPGPLKQSN
jgi:hypothetical protein